MMGQSILERASFTIKPIPVAPMWNERSSAGIQRAELRSLALAPSPAGPGVET
jgi:hypothetical protein